MSGFVGIVPRSVTLATVRFGGEPELEEPLVNRRPHPDTPRSRSNTSRTRKRKELSQASDSNECLVTLAPPCAIRRTRARADRTPKMVRGFQPLRAAAAKADALNWTRTAEAVPCRARWVWP